MKFALRQLLKSPGFTAVAVLTLALGIGATTTVFSLIYGVLLTPPPYSQPDRLALISAVRTDGQRYSRGWPAAQWVEWQKESKTFETIAAYGWIFNFLVLPDGSESIEGMRVTTDYFKALGVHPALGRAFNEADAKAEASSTVIIGYDLWQRRFNGDTNVIGQTVQISRQRGRHTIVGVMPPGVRFLPSPNVAQEPNYNVDAKVDYWLPAGLSPNNLKNQFAYLVGRLRPGVTMAEAQAEIVGLAARQAQADRAFEGISARVLSLESQRNLEGRRLLLPVAGAVALVFLIACGNAAGLLLARGLKRQHEYAIRTALGAGTLQLCRPVLLESLLLAMCGGVVGVALSVGCVDLLKSVGGAGIPRLDDVRIGWPLVAFCLGASVLAGLAAGVLPALRSLHRDPANELKAGNRTASLGCTERRLLGRVVTAQIALTLALLVGAGLLIRTVQSLAEVRPGYDTQNILTMSVTTVGTNYLNFHTAALERVAELPGVQAAAFGWGVPLTGNKWEVTLEIEGRPNPDGPGNRLSFPTRSVTPDYFSALGLKLMEGRIFRSGDNEQAPRVAMLNAAAVDRYFPGESALGRRLKLRGQTNLIEIVGVLANTRTDALTDVAEPELYLPFWQSSAFSKHLVVRTQGDPNLMATTVGRELRAIDPTVSVENIKTLERIRADSVASRTFAMNVLVVFALVACLLAVIGIYGVLSLAVGSRQTEIAIRMAVGAQRNDVLRMMLGDGMRLALVGVGIGLVVALLLATALKTYLFSVSPADPFTLSAMVIVVLAITLATCWIPARRAARVDPMEALRDS
ncbi:MAG: ABC transporter permease [Verrucomicrobiales bacterium]|nr:ABC transporter permease [Verrucomicrobiales bacterium]